MDRIMSLVQVMKWIRNLIRSWVRQSDRELLSELIASSDSREIFLGVKRQQPPTQTEIDLDLERAVRYSQSDDYAVWAKEAWADVLESVDKLAKDNLTDRQVDFYRGALNQTLKMLSVSLRARNMVREKAEEKRAV